MKFLKIIISLLLFLNISYAFAWVVDHFEVSFNKQEANVWEALDLTIKAVDENWDVVKDYMWNIIGFSETDDEVELPTELASDNWYTFTAANEWVMKFENWVIFHKPWEQELWIYDSDANENTIWLAKVKIKKTEEKSNVDIEILSPDNDLTIWKPNIKVSWKTEKNHQILIVVNDDKEFSTISNSEWYFEKEIEWLKTWKNVIQSHILDSEWKKIGNSNKVIITIDDTLPKFKKITLAPLSEKWEIDEWKNIIVNVYATPKLKEVSLIVNDSIVKLEETEDWVYTGNFNAPKWWETYSISAILKDNLGHNTTQKDIAKIIVKKLELASAEPAPAPQVEHTNTWTKNECDNIDLNIKNLKLVELKNKSILTWDKVKKADWYKVYKKNEDWTLAEVADTKKEVFEVAITWKKIKYNFFAIKAYKNCKADSWIWTVTKVWDLSEATKIKTWPEMIILLLLSLLLWAWFLFTKRRKS